MGKCMQTIVTPALSSARDGERVVERSHPWDRWSSLRGIIVEPWANRETTLSSFSALSSFRHSFLSFFLPSSRPQPPSSCYSMLPTCFFLARERDNRAYVSSVRLSGRSMPLPWIGTNRRENVTRAQETRERERERLLLLVEDVTAEKRHRYLFLAQIRFKPSFLFTPDSLRSICPNAFLKRVS